MQFWWPAEVYTIQWHQLNYVMSKDGVQKTQTYPSYKSGTCCFCSGVQHPSFSERLKFSQPLSQHPSMDILITSSPKSHHPEDTCSQLISQRLKLPALPLHPLRMRPVFAGLFAKRTGASWTARKYLTHALRTYEQYISYNVKFASIHPKILIDP